MNENRYSGQLLERPKPANLRSTETPVQSPPRPEADDEIDLLALLNTIWRGKWVIAAVATAFVLAGGYYAFWVATPMYTASATVVLDSREEQIVDIENVMSGLSGNAETLNTEVEVLSSRGLIEELVKRMDLTQDPEFNAQLRPKPRFSLGKLIALVTGGEDAPPPSERAVLDATIDNVLEAMSIANVRQSFVFRITMITQSPEKSARMADTLAQVYIDDQLAVKFEATETAVDWLTEQVAELKTDLEEAEAQVRDFSASTTLISPEALEVLNRQMKDLRERLEDARSRLQQAEQREAELEAARISGDYEWMADVLRDPAFARLLAQEADGTVLLDRFERIESRAEAERRRAQSQVNTLQQSITQLDQRIEAQSEDLVRLQQYQREAEASSTIYTYFLSRLKETSVQQGIQQADSRVLSDAVVPKSASAPRKPLVLGLSGILGLFAGAALVIGREAAKNTFRNSEDLTQITGYPVMGSIPQIPVRKRDKALEYVINKPASAAAEAVRNLRTSLMLSNVDRPPQVILSTSSVPGEGKSTQAILLAQNFAALGKKVLLVEGDMRRRVFPQYFDLDVGRDTPSLVSVLTGQTSLSEAVIHNGRTKLDILVSAQSKVNAADLYSSGRFATLVEDMRAAYDIIIIDTPPVLVVPDARVVALHVDAVLFSVRWDSTHRHQVRDGLRMLESVGVRPAGLVMSLVDPKGMKRYGYGSYHQYSGYYDT